MNFVFQSTLTLYIMNIKSTQIQELNEIKNLMERSSRFLSLSGLSGISAGIFALIGASIAHYIMVSNQVVYDEPIFYFLFLPTGIDIILPLFFLGVSVLLLTFASGFYFSWRKARKHGLLLWDHSSRRFLTHLFIPLVAGGLFVLILIDRNGETLVASATLIFYGLALVSAGKFTVGEIHYLGISEVILGIFAGIFVNYGLVFWAIGFGVLHIVYGSVMYFRYER